MHGQTALCPPHSSSLPGAFVLLLAWGFTPWGSQLLSGAGGWPGQAGMGSFNSTLELLFLKIGDCASRGAGPSSDAGGKIKSVVLRLCSAGNGAAKNPTAEGHTD